MSESPTLTVTNIGQTVSTIIIITENTAWKPTLKFSKLKADVLIRAAKLMFKYISFTKFVMPAHLYLFCLLIANL